MDGETAKTIWGGRREAVSSVSPGIRFKTKSVSGGGRFGRFVDFDVAYGRGSQHSVERGGEDEADQGGWEVDSLRFELGTTPCFAPEPTFLLTTTTPPPNRERAAQHSFRSSMSMQAGRH